MQGRNGAPDARLPGSRRPHRAHSALLSTVPAAVLHHPLVALVDLLRDRFLPHALCSFWKLIRMVLCQLRSPRALEIACAHVYAHAEECGVLAVLLVSRHARRRWRRATPCARRRGRGRRRSTARTRRRCTVLLARARAAGARRVAMARARLLAALAVRAGAPLRWIEVFPDVARARLARARVGPECVPIRAVPLGLVGRVAVTPALAALAALALVGERYFHLRPATRGACRARDRAQRRDAPSRRRPSSAPPR